METFSALLAICVGNSPVPGEFPTQRPVTRSFDLFFDLRLNKRLSKQSWGWWFETLLRPLWRQRNGVERFHAMTSSIRGCVRTWHSLSSAGEYPRDVHWQSGERTGFSCQIGSPKMDLARVPPCLLKWDLNSLSPGRCSCDFKVYVSNLTWGLVSWSWVSK